MNEEETLIADIKKRVASLTEQRANAAATIVACDGAIQVLEALLMSYEKGKVTNVRTTGKREAPADSAEASRSGPE